MIGEYGDEFPEPGMEKKPALMMTIVKERFDAMERELEQLRVVRRAANLYISALADGADSEALMKGLARLCITVGDSFK